MSITADFANLTPPNADTSYEGYALRGADFADTVASNFRKLRNTPPWDLGGTPNHAVVASGWTKVKGAREYQLSQARHAGLTMDMVIWRWVASGATLLARLVDEDSNVLAIMSAATSDTTPTRQVLGGSGISYPASDKWCWMEVKTEPALSSGYGYGYLRMR